MRRLYASIDRGASRSFGNVLNSYCSGTAQFKGVTQDNIRRIAAGFVFWKEEVESGQKMDADDVAYRLQTESVELTQIVTAYLLTCKTPESRSAFRRAPVIAALYETFNILKVKAAEFWDSVRDGVNMSDLNDPRLRLRTLLTTCGLEKREGSKRRLVTSEEMYRCAIHAWNAWRRGEGLEQLRGPVHTKRPKAR
jgi:hypothetical protein